MKRIIVLSDTHGLLRPEVLEYLPQVDTIEERDGVLWLNPGSCGRRRFDQEITFAIMTVDNGHTQVEKVVIPHEKGRT